MLRMTHALRKPVLGAKAPNLCRAPRLQRVLLLCIACCVDHAEGSSRRSCAVLEDIMSQGLWNESSCVWLAVWAAAGNVAVHVIRRTPTAAPTVS